MRLKRLLIRRHYVGLGNEPLRGEIEFESEDEGTKFEIAIDEALSLKIVHLCADTLVEVGQSAARTLQTEALATTAIEHQPES